VSEELPRYVQAVFPLSDWREDNFVAGSSMGGYGAFKLALNQPDRFAAAISLSGVLDIRDFARSKGIDLTYEEGPGDHTFDVWDAYIRRAFDWLEINGMLESPSR
jgi:S-formylglutathione hydrolase FrmB